MTSRPKSLEKAEKRRWRIPPPPLQDADSPGPEGLSILGEVDGELGILLWKSLRSVLLWAETDAANRRKLFDADAVNRRRSELLNAAPEAAAELKEALEDLLPILANPESSEAAYVADACRRIAGWAQRGKAHLTQLEYLQAAAVCCPEDARFALEVGSLARDLTHYARAEAWFYRAIGLARQSGDWAEYVTAYLKHGVMMFRRGALPAARRSFLKALRRSRRQGLRDGEARALHSLFNLEYLAGAPEKGIDYATHAVAVYGPEDERLPRLAHDVAYVWLERGDFEHSLPIFLETLSKVGPADRPTVLGSVGRAAAGMSDADAYEWALAELKRHPPAPGIADAWVEMARAALQLGRNREAEEAAELAEAVARARREGQIRFMADEVMEQIRSETASVETARTPSPEAPPAKDRLARELIRTLQAAPARRSEVRV